MIYTITLNPALDKEYTVPHLYFDDVMRMEKVRIDYGGKGFNVSRMLKALNTYSTVLGFVGGHTGEIISEGLERVGIKTELTQISGETRTNISIVDQEKTHYIKINEKGPEITKDEVVSLLDKVSEFARGGDIWVLAGSLPINVNSDIYAQIIRRVNKVGGYVILDTSGSALVHGIEAAPYLIKPNHFELSQIFDLASEEKDNILSLIEKTHGLGVRNILVSLGKDGALLSSPDGRWRAIPPIIKVQNPIGAGDAMVAGMVWRLAEGDSLHDALPWAVACGSAAASEPGTGMPSFELVNKFKLDVQIEEI